ncbi:MAG: hypothetical protein FWF29_02850 [Treponema sp.]|nr:hypothetical protein [Treponema sp.]
MKYGVGGVCFLFILLTCNAVLSMAQTVDKPCQIGGGLGCSFAGYREDTYTPINRRLNTVSFFLNGNVVKEKLLHSFDAGFFMGYSQASSDAAILMQDYDPQTGAVNDVAFYPRYRTVRGYLEYALDHRFWGNNAFPGFLGGAFRADAYLQFANYPSITGLVSLDLHATQKWIINSESAVTFAAGFPIFGFAVRPPYAGADQALIKYAASQPLKILTLGRVISLHNYWAVFGDIKYQHSINSFVAMYSGLGFELSRINFPKPRLDAILRINGGVAFTF